jgi:FdrA protein
MKPKQNRLAGLLRDGPVAINIGVREFSEPLKKQAVPVVHVDWSPPAGGDAEMMSLLDKLL